MWVWLMNVGCRTLGKESKIFNEHQRVKKEQKTCQIKSKKRKENLPANAMIQSILFLSQQMKPIGGVSLVKAELMMIDVKEEERE